MADDPNLDPQPDPDEAAIVAEVDEITKSPQDQQQDKIKHALIAAKRELRASKRENQRLEPIAARVSEVDGQLQKAQPIINAVTSNPTLLAEAMRIAGGGAPSRAGTTQPMDDVDATEYAQDAGYFLADGYTPDAARGRRVLDRQAKAIRQVAEEVVRPLAGVTLNDRAERNIQAAIAETDDDGTPMATEESIREVVAQLPQHLIADPKVRDVVLNTAIGIDRRKHRTPKAQEAPLYLESPGGRRGTREPAIDSDLKDALKRHGVSEKTFQETSKRLEEGVAQRHGIILGR